MQNESRYKFLCSYKRMFVVLLTLICCLSLILFHLTDIAERESLNYIPDKPHFSEKGFTDLDADKEWKCQIPKVGPYGFPSAVYHSNLKYAPCSRLEPLTYVFKTNNNPTLYINNEVAPLYSKFGIRCCYSNIERRNYTRSPDSYYSLSVCNQFQQSVILEQDFVRVRCRNFKKTIYQNTHSAIIVRNKSKNKERKEELAFSVLVLGMHSVSRLNFIRSLQKTHLYLLMNGWMSAKGYNKIADEAFPNRMAAITGLNETQIYEPHSDCNPFQSDTFHRCPFIWNEFKKYGYVTAYGEDNTNYSPFNLEKKGFTHPPTDYYFRPYFLASETLQTKKKSGVLYCSGPETSTERVLNVVRDFVTTFKNRPSFGYFWMNSFSQSDISTPSRMDKKLKEFFEFIASTGVLQTTVVVFLSDHGVRFGKFRDTPHGWYEERLPFLYISVPRRLRLAFPTDHDNLYRNMNKLTNPYDLYMTLQHLLVMSGFQHEIKRAKGCPNCQPLFTDIDPGRTCEDIAINEHWCVCNNFERARLDVKFPRQAAVFIVDQINALVRSQDKDLKCERFSLRKIVRAFATRIDHEDDKYLVLVLETKPKVIFEATLRYRPGTNQTFEMKGSSSRLSGPHNRCINVDNVLLKKYCYCKG